MQVNGREKTGMTVLKVVYNETRNTLLRAYFMCFFLTEILHSGCTEGVPSSKRSSGRGVAAYPVKKHIALILCLYTNIYRSPFPTSSTALSSQFFFITLPLLFWQYWQLKMK
jgi:hypothetical protein